MMYIGFLTIDRNDRRKPEIAEKAKKWWNDGEAPKGLKIVASYGAVGTNTPDVLVFESEDNLDIQKMVSFWAPVGIEIHPAFDLLDYWRTQGMAIPTAGS
jgi:hypothetical protein